MLLLFTDYQRDRETLQLLVTALGITGVICMLLSLLGSYFMANKAMKPIQKAWQQQRDFLADASHELRTPLAVIQTNLDVVRDAPAETVANQLRWLNNIHEEVQQMTGLVKSLLFLSQTDSQQQFLKKKMFALDQAMLAAAGAFRPVAAQKEINLIAQTSGGVLYHGDEGKLRQAISILLDNAIRHTPVNGEIKIGLEVIRQTIVLSVADSGEGIAAAEIGKIFLRFYQSDSSRSNGGAGLGLSIAKWIVESHGGVIKAASILGKGATFTIRLPHTAHRAAGT
jgi:signal transduction histidine kinase